MADHSFFELTTRGGDFSQVFATSLAVVLVFMMKGRVDIALRFAVAVAVPAILTVAGKIWLYAGGNSLLGSPSGHSSLSAAVYVCLALILVQDKAAVWKYVILASTVLLVLLIATSRKMLGLHSIREVVVGLLFGLLGVLVFLMLKRKLSVAERSHDNSVLSGARFILIVTAVALAWKAGQTIHTEQILADVGEAIGQQQSEW